MMIDEKIAKLEDFLKDKRCILAFSGGSDSSLIAYILSKVSPESLLVTIDNHMMPSEFIDYTRQKAKEYNLKHEVVDVNFLEDPKFIANDKSRCFECRKLMYSKIKQIPQYNDYDYLLEGTNITDLFEDRPGVVVNDIHQMVSPLIECDITKDDVFEIINHLGLTYSTNTTCLSTRIKTDQEVSHEKLTKVDVAEKYMHTLINQENIRLRIDGNTATIVVDEPLEILDKNLIEKLTHKLQALGYEKIQLDITGYKKTKVVPQNDGQNNTYQLPYEINMDETYKNMKKSSENSIKCENYIKYNDILIYQNGKIIIPQKYDFSSKINKIIKLLKRKSVEYI